MTNDPSAATVASPAPPDALRQNAPAAPRRGVLRPVGAATFTPPLLRGGAPHAALRPALPRRPAPPLPDPTSMPAAACVPAPPPVGQWHAPRSALPVDRPHSSASSAYKRERRVPSKPD